MLSRLFLCLSLLLLAFPAPVAAHAQASATAAHLSVELLVPPAQLTPGQSFTAGLHFKLEPHWHVYWLNAGDSGEPPRATWTLPAGITAGPMQFPTPKRLPLGPLMDFGYEDEVVFPVRMQVARTVSTARPAVLTAKVDWLVCREVCLPGKATLSVHRPVSAGGGTATDEAAAALIAKYVAREPQPLPSGAQARFATSGKSLTVEVLTGKSASSAQFFPYDQNQIANAGSQPVSAASRGVRITLTQDESTPGPPAALHGLLVLGSPDSNPLLAYEVRAVPGTLSAPAAAATTVDASGLLRAAGLAFLGGIILNLMPCVFPVLFIKGLSLVHSSQQERGRMRAHGWVFTLGILVSFWLVVGLLLGLRAAGHQLGWGFQFQSPVFLAIMALFLFFLALSLAGQFEIGLSLTSAGGELASKSGYAGSFFTGVLAMVVATPCTAPFMGAAIGYALGASAVVSFAVFTALGLGLAAPYLLLAYHPAWTRLLPRPGAWMEVLKQAIAVPIFATVIWLVWLFTSGSGANALLGLLGGFLLLGVAGWILGRWPAKLPATLAAALVLALAVALPIVAVDQLGTSGPSARAAAQGNDWIPFTPGAVATYRAQGRPVLVDFTASWCLSCQVNERVVLDRADVQKRLRESGVALIKADWTHHDESIGQALASLGRSGIPTYALYPAAPGSPPQLLPEVLTPGIVYSALAGLHAGAAKGF
jgi:thiol:disulfide interchange protein DsbD